MNDDAIEHELRAWLATHTEPGVPESLRQFLLDLPRSEPDLHRVRRGSPILTRVPRRDLALILVAAAAAVAVGASLIAGGLLRSPGPTPSESAQATVVSSASETASPITVEPYAGDFFPTALAVADPTHLVVVGASGDGVGNGVVAVSDDAGHGWYVRRLSTAALLDVAAAGSSILTTTACSGAAAGCVGGVALSSDGGPSWAPGPTIGLRHPTLLDQQRGWAASPTDLTQLSTEFSTADGGRTWTASRPPCGAAGPALIVVEFASGSVGWAACVGDSGTGTQTKELLATTDGGTTWSVTALVSADPAVTAVGSIPLRGQLGGISMLADGHGWLWTDQALYASSDGGRTWSPVGWGDRVTPTAVSAAALVGDGIGYALVRDDVEAHLIRTSDGGSSWVELGTWPIVVNPPLGPSPRVPPETIRYDGFANAAVGWAVTDRRLILTEDGGKTWRTAGPPVDYAAGAPKGATFFDSNDGWLVSEDTFTSTLNLWRTADGGITWTRTTLPSVPNAAETMGDARTFWIDGTHAVIDVAGGMPNGYTDGLLITADGGATWSEPMMRSVTPGADGITGDVFFLDPKVGWLGGGAPGTRLWATRDGGSTWRLQQLAVPTGYLDDQGGFFGAPTFWDRTDGVVARTFANNQSTVLVIYRTSDGGKTWQPVHGAAPNAASWSFPSASDWILWDPSTTMWRSTDQGQSWTRQVPTGLPSDASPVMTDDLHGWALSTNAGLLITADGGRTWTVVDPLSAATP